jgi:hypothetical protein
MTTKLYTVVHSKYFLDGLQLKTSWTTTVGLQLPVQLKIQEVGVGLSIRFGRSPSFTFGQSGTPSKSVGYQPELFLRWISMDSNQNSWSSSNFRSVGSSNRFQSDQVFTVCCCESGRSSLTKIMKK